MIRTYAWRRLTAAVILLAHTHVAYGADAPSLSLSQAVERALIAHPALGRSELAQAAGQSTRDELAQTTPWALSVEVENFAGSGGASGFKRSETTVGVSKVVERGDKRVKRTALGNANVSLLSTQDRGIRIAVAGNAAKAFVGALAEQRRLEIVDASRAQAEGVRDQVSRRVAVGRSADAELATADIAVARARLAARRSTANQAVKQQHLATALAEDTPSFGRLLGNIESLPELEDFAVLRAKLETNPELTTLTQQQAIRDAELNLARANQRPDLTLGAGVRQLAGPDDTALVVSFSMPLGQKRRAAASISAARNRQESIPLLRSERKRELATELFALHSDLRAVADEYQGLSEDILPVAERAVRLYQSGFERGRYALFELSAAQRTLLEAQRDAVNIAEQYQMLFINLQAILGEVPGQGVHQ